MRVAILHYHLRPGGVTRVIQNALFSLSDTSVQTVVIAGEPPSDSMPVPNTVVVESLGYGTPLRSHSLKELVNELKDTAEHALGGPPDVWHIHNHALGKNLVIPEITYHLAEEGQRLLLQIHDFAEDGRPENYKYLRENLCMEKPHELSSHLYPQGSHVHYALINQRDLKFFKTSGGDKKQLHYLPNAIDTENSEISKPEEFLDFQGKRLFLYPTRAIRRKNIGEFLFWSVFAQENDIFAITRAPKNPLALPIYEDWVAFATSLALPVKFAFGNHWQADFTSLLQSAHALVTTSVAEGFGLAFLEPWLLSRPLLGRNLPEITDAIKSTGVDLSTLYNRLDVLLEWVSKHDFEQEVARHLQTAYTAYGRTAHANDIQRAVASAIKDESIDFGKLHEKFQKSIIQQLVKAPSLRKEIAPSTLEQTQATSELFERNQKTIIEQFNLEKYGQRLLQLYRTVAASKAEALSEFDADVLLDQFLAPERFCLLRT